MGWRGLGAVVLALCGCGGPPLDPEGEATEAMGPCDSLGELPSCELASFCGGTDTASPAPNCVAPVVWTQGCQEPWPDDAFSLSRDGLVFAGDAPGPLQQQPSTFMISDEAAWSALIAEDWGGSTPPAVDFETHLVVVAQYNVNSTCGLTVGRHGVRTAGDGPVALYVEFEDPTGTCREVCDAEGFGAVVYAVPRERGWPNVCATVTKTCR